MILSVFVLLFSCTGKEEADVPRNSFSAENAAEPSVEIKDTVLKQSEGKVWLDTIPDFTRSYRGRIDKYGIEMYLCKTGKHFFGFYKYQSKTEFLQLAGHFDSKTGQVVLVESTTDSETGYFKGLLSNNEFRGEWMTPEGGRPVYDVLLFKSDITVSILAGCNAEVGTMYTGAKNIFPVLSFPCRPAIENKINRQIYRDDSCLDNVTSFTYKNYLQLVYEYGCRPKIQYDERMYDLRTGNEIKFYVTGTFPMMPLDIFRPEKRRELLAVIVPLIQQKYDEGKGLDCYYGDERRPKEIDWNDIEIRLSKEGIVFHYNFEYPGSCAYMPEGDAFLRWKELEEYLVP